MLFSRSLLAAAVLSSFVANAADEDEDFFSMSIEELLTVETDVAGFRAEAIADSPSVVSVFTAKQIKALGANNVYDLMNFVPGFQTVLGEWLSGHNKLQSRGVYLDTGYVLVMKDGIRLNELSFGKASVYTPYIDISSAERVEVIRGPGSSVYGSNAFLGVINIISKRDNELSAEIGSNGHTRFTANTSKKLQFGDLAFNLAMVKGEGQKFVIEDANEVADLSIRRPYKHLEFSALYNFQDFSLGYYYDQHELDDFVNLNGYHPHNRFDSNNQYLKAAYSFQANDKLNVNFDVQFAEHEVESAGLIFEGSIPPVSEDFLTGPYWKTDRLTLNVDASYQYNDKLDLVFGAQYQEETQTLAGVVSTHITPDGENVIPFDDFYVGDINTYSELGEFSQFLQTVESQAFFAEGKYQLGEGQTLHLGGRFEDYKQAGSAFSPRLSYINKFAENQQVKAIYSEAFRAPVTNELYSDDGVTLGNPNLKPELVKTLEVQYMVSVQDLAVEATIFNNRLSELIASEQIDDSGRTTFVNKGSDNVTGVELLTHYSFDDWITGRATYTHFLSDTIEGAYDAFGSVSLMMDFDKFNASFNVLYRPEVKITEGLRFESTGETVFSENNVFIVGGQVEYQLGRNLALNIAADNLFDESYRVYEPRQNINKFSVPQLGRTIRVSATYQF